MIDSVSKYKFVTGKNRGAGHENGDLDRIVIDGGIMPMRNSLRKNDLRGEDITFLLESAITHQRVARWDPSVEKVEFSREVLASQIRSIFNGLSDGAQLNISKTKTIVGKTWIYHGTDETEPPWRPGFEKWDIRSLIDVDVDENDVAFPKAPKSGDPVDLRPIERLFEISNALLNFQPHHTSGLDTPWPYQIQYSGPVIPSSRVVLQSGGAWRHRYLARRSTMDATPTVEENYNAKCSYGMAGRTSVPAMRDATFEAWALLHGSAEVYADGEIESTNVYRLAQIGSWALSSDSYYTRLHTDNGMWDHFDQMKSAAGITDLTIPSGVLTFRCNYDFHVDYYYPVIRLNRTAF